MPARKPKLEYAIICDDIREETGNKLSLIGMYQREIFVPKFPFPFPKLCFFLSYKNVKGGDSFSMQLKSPSGKQLGSTIKGAVPQGIKHTSIFIASAIFSPLVADGAGLYRLLVTFNDDEKNRREIEFDIKQRG
jgi:hypothetical protein